MDSKKPDTATGMASSQITNFSVVISDPFHPSDDEDNEDDDDFDTSDSSDLGILDADNTPNAKAMEGNAESHSTDHDPSKHSLEKSDTGASTSSAAINKQNKRTEERKHRGMMQGFKLHS